jgi:hypothetical protein
VNLTSLTNNLVWKQDRDEVHPSQSQRGLKKEEKKKKKEGSVAEGQADNDETFIFVYFYPKK